MVGPRRKRAWVVLAALLVAGGVAGSHVGASQIASRTAAESRQILQRSSDEVASTLQLAIQHQDDLVVNASGFVVANPDATEADFRAWATSVHVLDRYPEVLGFGFAVVVRASELPDFAARVSADAPTVLSSDGAVEIVPAGIRPFYCLTKLGQIRTVQGGTPAGFDWCAAPGVGPAFLRARDSGTSAYSPLVLAQKRLLAVAVPVYRGGIVPTTAAARRGTILGWVATESVPEVLLARAMQGHADMSVVFRYREADSDVGFSHGAAPEGAVTVKNDLDNGWTVETSGVVVSGTVTGNGDALALLYAGIAVSFLVGALVYVLGTSRARAWRLVQEYTAQLRGAQAQLVDTARQAGMAEIATNVLHNVGNVLNSVNVSAELVSQKVRGSKSAGLGKAVALIHEHADDLGHYLTTDARGKALPGYLDQLSTSLRIERESIEEELLRLRNGVAHIKEIVNAQQSLAGVAGVIESMRVSDVVEEALRMAGVLGAPELTVTRDFAQDPVLALDRHRVLLVLLNLIGNAMHAMKRDGGAAPLLSVRAEVTDGHAVITVTDNGGGILPENLPRIFVHGFTTHVDGHGFGLHSSALAAKEMGGTLSVHSDGAGAGAVFTLDVPVTREAVPV